MPQLDVTTFLGQVTWFTVVFVRFYLARTTEVLPALNRVVKLRVKKRDQQRGELRQFDGVRTSAEEGVDGTQVRMSKKVLARLAHQRTQRALSSAVSRWTSLPRVRGM